MAYYMNHIKDNPDNISSNIILFIVSSLPYMFMVGKFSKNLAFDSMLFYLLWLVGFWGVMLFTPTGGKLNWIQIAALIVSILGLVMVKVFE